MDGHGIGDAAEPIVCIHRSEVRAGGLEELKAGIRRVVPFPEPLEPRLLSYGFHIDDGTAAMTIVAVHPDPASLEFHLGIGDPEFRELAHLLTLTSIECYGRPSVRALDRLRRKAAALGDGATIPVVGRFAGFAHLGSAAGPPPTAPRSGGSA
jgi:hypothetical protein